MSPVGQMTAAILEASCLPLSRTSLAPSCGLSMQRIHGPCQHTAWRPLRLVRSIGQRLAHVAARRILERRMCLGNGGLDISMPEIDGELRTVQADWGASFEGDVPMTFGNDDQAAQALQSGVALVDRSHWGRLRISGDDRLTFLHGQSTADITNLQQGEGCETVFVTRTGRIIDLATCLVQGSSVLAIVSHSRRNTIKDRLEQYIFRGDKVEVQDVTNVTCCFTLAGPGSDAIVAQLGAERLAMQSHGTHALFGSRSGQPIVVSVGSGLHHAGYTLISGQNVAADVWQQLVKLGAVPMGESGWERARVLAGRPAADMELTDLYNPLEAALYHAVSVKKGCYIGQETLSKVIHNDAVKQQLWGLRPCASVNTGDKVTDDTGRDMGMVTSVTEGFALGFLRSRIKGEQVQLEGRQVFINGCSAEVVNIPVATRTVDEGPLLAVKY